MSAHPPLVPWSSRPGRRQQLATTTALLLSALAHGLLLWGVADWRPHTAPAPKERIVQVRLIMPPDPQQQAATTPSAPPAPTPVAAVPPPPKLSKPVPTPPRLLSKRTTPAPLRAPPPTTVAAKTETALPAVTTTTQPSGPDTTPTMPAAANNADISAPPAPPAAPDPAELEHYRETLGQRFAGLQHYPRVAALRGWEGEVLVRMVVARKGVLISAYVLHSSGFPVLDDSALALIQESGPLPPPPGLQEGGEVEITVPVRYRLRKQG